MDVLHEWSEFNVAMLGAAAALAGLVIVASSVNIAEIVKAATITSRLAAGIAGLVLAIVASGVGLVPEIDPVWWGVCVLAAAVGAGAFQVHATRVIYGDPSPEDRARFAKSALGFLPIAAYAAAGLTVFVAPGPAYVLAAVGCVVAIPGAIIVSWVALVEVLR